MLFGDNAKKVFEMLIEFIDKKDTVEPKLIPNGRSFSDIGEIFTLIEIVERFVLKPDYKPEKIFNEINDAYNELPGGIIEFIRFRKVLEKEKNAYGFHNLAHITKRRQLKKSSVT